MNLIVAVVAQKYREDKECGNTRKQSRNDRQPQMTSAIQYSSCAFGCDEEIKLPDGNCPKQHDTNASCPNAGYAFSDVAHLFTRSFVLSKDSSPRFCTVGALCAPKLRPIRPKVELRS